MFNSFYSIVGFILFIFVIYIYIIVIICKKDKKVLFISKKNSFDKEIKVARIKYGKAIRNKNRNEINRWSSIIDLKAMELQNLFFNEKGENIYGKNEND